MECIHSKILILVKIIDLRFFLGMHLHPYLPPNIMDVYIEIVTILKTLILYF